MRFIILNFTNFCDAKQYEIRDWQMVVFCKHIYAKYGILKVWFTTIVSLLTLPFIEQTFPINLTTADSPTVNYDEIIVIVLLCSIVLTGLIIVTLLLCFCCQLSPLESLFESPVSPKTRRVAKHRKKKAKEHSVPVVEDKQLSANSRGKMVPHCKLSTVSSQVQKSKTTFSKGNGNKSKTSVVATKANPVVPSSKQTILPKVSVAKVCTSKQGPKMKKKASLAVAPPPVRLDPRFGTMNSKLQLDVDIDHPSKSALDLSIYESSVTGSFLSQNKSVGTILLKRCSTSAKVTSKHQQKRHHKHKKTA